MVGHRLVGWRDDEDRIATLFQCGQSRQGKGRRRIAANRLKQKCTRLDTAFPQLFARKKTVFFVADDQGSGNFNICRPQSGNPVRRLLEKAFIASQGKELLGKAGT